MMVTSGAITQRLDRLEQRGLVTRHRNRDDERSIVVQLTSAGSRLVERVLPSHVETEARLLDGLSAREQKQLAGLLRKLLVSHEEE
jgi:DNA-binding MarR family transcriptional regulator